MDPGDPPPQRIDPEDVPPGRKGWNNDPVQHSWNPGSVEEQRAHFRPDTDDYMPKAKPEREGPDYAVEHNVEADEAFWIRLDLPADVIPPRAQFILQGPALVALGEFVRYNLQYGNTDESLGLQGQFAEIHHITAKLKRMLWDKRHPATIKPDGIKGDLESLIGHALLALDLLDKENFDGR
jgi:hypothetical protein